MGYSLLVNIKCVATIFTSIHCWWILDDPPQVVHFMDRRQKVKTWNGFGFSVLRLEICVGSQSGPCRTLIVIPTSCWNMRFHNGLSQVRWHPEWVTHICNKGFVSLIVRADTTGPLDELNRYLHGHAQYIIVVDYIVLMIVFTFLIENRIVDK